LTWDAKVKQSKQIIHDALGELMRTPRLNGFDKAFKFPGMKTAIVIKLVGGIPFHGLDAFRERLRANGMDAVRLNIDRERASMYINWMDEKP
jgi:hypothetical protein